MERVGDLEAEGPRGASGRGVGLPSKTQTKKVVESKVVLNLAELTDDKHKFRQWDIKLANALAHVERSYGWAMECIKERIDGGGRIIQIGDAGLEAPVGRRVGRALDVDRRAGEAELVVGPRRVDLEIGLAVGIFRYFDQVVRAVVVVDHRLAGDDLERGRGE